MAFNLKLQESFRRKERIAEFAAETFTSLLEPFRLQEAYPSVSKMVNGVWKEERIIQPHQMKLHEGKSLNGKDAKYILFSGGVGCVGGETVIGGRPVRDWVRDRKAPACLTTLFGEAVPEAPYLKGRDDLYRVRTQSGREVVVTAAHRFLGVGGWVRLADLAVGELIASDGSWHGSSGTEKPRDWSNGCFEGSRQGGELPCPAEVADQDRWRPLRRTGVGNNAWQGHGLLYTGGFYRRTIPILQRDGEKYQRERDAYGAFQDRSRTPCLTEPLTLRQDSGRLLLASECLSEETYRLFRYGCRDRDIYDSLLTDEHQVGERLRADYSVRGTERELHRDQASCPNCTAFWDRITSVEWERFDDYYDIGVPGPEHYSAEGIWHHNSGKSLTMSAEVWRSVRTEPGIKWVVALPFDFYFAEFLRPTWNKVVPEDSPHIASYNVKEHSYVFTNGSEVRFHAYDEADKIKGWECHRIWIEEGSELGQGNNEKATDIWNALNMRLRASQPAYPLRMYVTQNPKGHNWLWKIFIRSEPLALQLLGDEGKETIFGYTANGKPKAYYEWEKVTPGGDTFYTLAVGTVANDHIPLGYVDSMLGALAESPTTRQSMVEGKFNPIASLAYEYPIYSERTHVIDYQRFLDYWEIDEIPKWWKVGVGIDCGGQRSPWAVEFFVQTESGEWVCFDEIYQKGLTWTEIIELIKEHSEGFKNVEYWIDPISSQHTNGMTSTTIQEEFQERGIICNMPKGYNKQGGLSRVWDLMRRDHSLPCPYMDDIPDTEDDGTVKWQNGHSQIYYLTNVPGKHSVKNPKGHAAPANLAEKGVFRYDTSKHREPKASEEGLTPVLSVKLMDRDDHAQTAEFFLFIGQKPLVKKTVSDRSKRQPVGPDRDVQMYGRGQKHRRIW